MENNQLYHHGILGMKWGVRRYQNKNGSLTSAGRMRKRDNMSDDARNASRLKKKKLNELTNAELRQLNDRQNLERTYTTNNPSAFKRGMSAAGSILSVANTIINIVDKGGKVMNIGQKAGNKVIGSFGNTLLKNLPK